MLIAPVPLGNMTLPKEVLEADKAGCSKAGSCGAGKRAIYIGSALHARHYYIPWENVRRVFKRVAMSSGGFTGKGLFGTLAYIVVQYGNGKEIQCRMRRESEADKLLEFVLLERPGIPLHSVEAEKKLAEAARAERARYRKTLSEEAKSSMYVLNDEIAFLEKRASFGNALTAAAKQKRIIDNLSPSYRIGGAVLGILGLICIVYGAIGLLTHQDSALYFLLGGGAAFFLTLATNTFPSRWNSKKTAQEDWDKAVADMRKYIGSRPSFSVPAQYAHPIVLARMVRVLREGRAETIPEAFSIMKADLKALNSSVTVSQKEYDEVVKIKPLFLVCNYKDEI